MLVLECVGRLRVCAFCCRKFWQTDEPVFVEENSEDNLLCRVGENGADQLICVNGWKKTHPGISANFVKKRLCEVQRYFTWPELRAVG